MRGGISDAGFNENYYTLRLGRDRYVPNQTENSRCVVIFIRFQEHCSPRQKSREIDVFGALVLCIKNTSSLAALQIPTLHLRNKLGMSAPNL